MDLLPVVLIRWLCADLSSPSTVHSNQALEKGTGIGRVKECAWVHLGSDKSGFERMSDSRVLAPLCCAGLAREVLSLEPCSSQSAGPGTSPVHS